MKCEKIGNCKLYLDDCREILPEIGKADTVVTDPVWPDNGIQEFNEIDPYKLFSDTFALIDAKRAVINLGIDSNPNILTPIQLPFFRVAMLEYALPGHKGRLLNTGTVAYMYGAPPRPIPGKKLISGKYLSHIAFGNKEEHPCSQRLDHVKFLVYQFSDPEDLILDPFMGSGTTGVACVELNRKFIGIEINEKYFYNACKRIENSAAQGKLNFEEG
jgi:site-specific DNA-methyltransferase (adenine-specific)/modification methylase